MEEEVNFDLDNLATYDIPISVYHIDGHAWSDGKCGWALGEALKTRLQANNLRVWLHYWGCCQEMNGCATLDMDRIYGQLGATLGGIYLDDPQTGLNNGATDELAKATIDWLQSKLPGDSEVIMKAYRGDGTPFLAGIEAYGHTCYINDLSSDFLGLKVGIIRVFEMSTSLSAPFNEFTAYDGLGRTDKETYFRRIHWGALQPVMEHDPWIHAGPWEAEYADESSSLVAAYRYFSWLHYELVPYLHSYDWQAYETGEPILRDPDPLNFTTKLGEEIFAAYVTEPGTQQLQITLPPGEWIDYWDTSQTYTGSILRPVPLGREPVFIRNGAIVPMQVSRSYTGHGTTSSEGSLTVLVYPNGKSRFRYRDDVQQRWIAIGAELTGNTLTLGTSDAPSQPLLYRVERWTSAPTAVSICGTTVTVNKTPGLPQSLSEDAVNGATTNAWFYDAEAKRLIVKVVP